MNLEQALSNLTAGIRDWVNSRFIESDTENIKIKEIVELDVDAVIEPGYYYISSEYDHTNLPKQIDGGLLIVYADPTATHIETEYRIYQMFISYNNSEMFMRNKKGLDGFSDWQELSFVNKSISLHGILASCDINEVTKPGYYYVSSTNTYTNLPTLNRGGLLIVYNDSTASAQVGLKRGYQVYISYNNTMFIRVLETSQGAIGAWKEYKSSQFDLRGALASCDLNDVLVPGYHYLSTTDTYSNSPTNNKVGGLLIVYNDSEAALNDNFRLYQMLIVGGTSRIFVRTYIKDNQFTPWAPLATIDELTSKMEASEGMKKADFLKFKSGNLFDGEWIEGKRLAYMPDEMYLQTDDRFHSLALIGVKPNTQYTVIIDNPLEEEYWNDPTRKFYYFGVATATRLMLDNETFDGSYQAKNTTAPTYYYQFTTGPDDIYVYIQAGMNHRPYMQVVEGYIDAINAAEYSSAVYELSDKIFIQPNTPIERANLFDGNYSEGIDIGGSANSTTTASGMTYKTTSTPKRTSTIILEVEPNTTYSIIKEKTGREGSSSSAYYYFKVAAATKLMTANNEKFDGSFSYANTAGFTTNYTFTTGSNDRYVYIMTSINLKPFVQIVKGTQTEFTVSDYESNPCTIRGKDVAATFNQPQSYLNNASKGKLNFYKWLDKDPRTSGSISTSNCCPYIVITSGRNTYTFVHDTSTSINLDTWRWYNQKLDGDVLWASSDTSLTNTTCLWNQSDNEGVIKQHGAADFIGGFHGDEKYTGITILVDGEEISESEFTIRHNCKNITLIVTSNVYFCEDTQNIAFNRTKKIEFIGDKVTVYNTWEYVGSSTFAIDRSTLGGLYSVRKVFLNGVSSNAANKYFKSTTTTTSSNLENWNKDLDIVAFYGKDFTLYIRSLVDKGEYYKGCIQDFGTQERYKAYLDDINSSSGACTLSKGDILRGCFEIETLS